MMAQRSNPGKSDWKLWTAVILLLAAFVAVQQWLSRTPTKYVRTEISQPLPGEKKPPEPKEASMTPGRVVELDTTRGRIDFVLFEDDCPVTSSRIVELVHDGCYTNAKFDRVIKNSLIQTAVCRKQVKPIGVEALKGLINTKGAVGMARQNDPNSGTSSFYVLLEPWRHLDFDYTVFGRLIRGMDVALKIKQGDSIKTARVRSLTPEDRKLFDKVLEIEVKRKTE
jgi:cyclophilin family peptidyl-prolyl cis-trans isomerase